MVLAIIPELKSEIVRDAPSNIKLIDYKAFNSPEIHPFIATNKWDRVDVVLGKGIQSGYLKQVLTKCNIIHAIIPSDLEIDFEIVSRLSEIYPEAAAKLRKAYMQKEDIKPILIEEGAEFD